MYKSLTFLNLFFILLFLSCENNTKTTEKISEPIGELEHINKRIKADSTNTLLYNERASFFLESNQIDKALMDINKALQYDSKNASVFLNLAEVYFAMGRPENCSSALLKAADLDSENPKPFLKLAELNLVLEKFDMALAYTDKSLDRSSFNPEAFYVRGAVFIAKQDTVSALKNFKLALDQKEDFFEPMMQLGVIYSQQRNHIAEQYLKKAIFTYPEAIQARYQLAMYLQDNENVAEAILHYDTILMTSPQNKFALYNLGYVHLVYLEDFTTAVQYFDDALVSDPNYLDALYNKGRALEELGKFVVAKEVYNDVLRRSPSHDLAIQALNRIDMRK
ncbi:MAG: hypothetical protein CVT92_06960 [Bacteroidetes bacterium HGW-Bacteroidetes-1]|jgi:tetratricopeptide (TPR) repeat protein|nr:MAG: hypothetical protein CVT92_06960 [Bacteroidetes bacterium HGW-Bacteroidetes-1]